jgi:hypothetical protein
MTHFSRGHATDGIAPRALAGAAAERAEARLIQFRQQLFLRGFLGRDRQGEAGFFAVRGRAFDDADFDGFVESGMDAGQQLDGFFFFTGGDSGAEFFFHAAQFGNDAAVVQLFAGAVTHPAFG